MRTRFEAFFSRVLMNGLVGCVVLMGTIGSAADKNTSTPPEEHLLFRESFEDGDGDSPTNWSQGKTIPGVTYVWDRESGFESQCSLGFAKSVDRYFPVAKWARHIPRTGTLPAISVSAMVKAENAGKAILDVSFLDENGKFLGHRWVGYIGIKQPGDAALTHDWKKYSGTVAIDPKAVTLVIGLQMYGPGQVRFDQVEARYAESVPEPETPEPVADEEPDPDLLKRGILLSDGFEQGDKRPRGWMQGAAVPGVTYVWDKETASEGKRSLSLMKSANRYFPIAQWERTLRHTGKHSGLKLSVQVKAAAASKAIVDVAFIDKAGKWIRHDWVSYIGAKQAGAPPVSHDWKEYTGSVAIPPKSAKIQFGLQIYGPGRVWFDRLHVQYADTVERPQSKPASPVPTLKSSKERTSVVPESAIRVNVTDSAAGHYLLIAPEIDADTAPDQGYGLVIVLSGGAGTADFHPFVRKIHQYALNNTFLVAQPLAVRWHEKQQIVWPTGKSPVAQMKFNTEALVGAVIKDVAAKHTLNSRRVYILGWSSGGPAAYATLLQSQTPVAGGLIAMSVFKPKFLPTLDNARDRRFYLLHSPDDPVCPYRMAAAAREVLKQEGAIVALADYPGGHGWRGDVFGNIRAGIKWLDEAKAEDR